MLASRDAFTLFATAGRRDPVEPAKTVVRLAVVEPRFVAPQVEILRASTCPEPSQAPAICDLRELRPILQPDAGSPVVTQSERGERLMTVVRTTRTQGKAVLDFMFRSIRA